MLRSIRVMAGPSPSRVTGVLSSSGRPGQIVADGPFERKGRLRIDPVGRHARAPQAHLLLHGEHAVEVDRIALALEQRDQRRTARPVVKRLAAHRRPGRDRRSGR